MIQLMEHQQRRASTQDVLNLNELVERCLGNLEFVERLLEQFEGRLAADVEVMTQAAGREDLETVGQIAHRIKGASANVAAPALVKVAAEIESAARNDDLGTIWSRLPVLKAERDRFRRSTPQFARNALPHA